MIGAYDERLLRTIEADRLRTAGYVRVGRAGRRLRRALHGAEAAHRKALRADRRAVQAWARLAETPTRVAAAR
ncbi:MAG TPA: hypothetical protein VFL94_13470 [Actinomycetales bacterium]|nr:hypothetical protein [Actinomycetales bacterium]